MKDVGLRIRVQKDLREKFVEACHREDKPAAQVLREFMRDYVELSGVADERGEKSRTARKGS
jgi:hypothetical protein